MARVIETGVGMVVEFEISEDPVDVEATAAAAGYAIEWDLPSYPRDNGRKTWVRLSELEVNAESDRRSYALNDRVIVTHGFDGSALGTVVGVAHQMACIGLTYLVQLDCLPNDIYPYTTVVVSELAMSPAE